MKDSEKVQRASEMLFQIIVQDLEEKPAAGVAPPYRRPIGPPDLSDE